MSTKFCVIFRKCFIHLLLFFLKFKRIEAVCDTERLSYFAEEGTGLVASLSNIMRWTYM